MVDKSGSQGGEATASPLRTRSLRVHRRLRFSPAFSFPRVFRSSSETKDRARLACHQDPHRTAPDALKHLALLSAEPRQDWSRALGDLLARPPRSLLSPPVRGPVCVGSTQTPRPQGEQKGPQAAKTQPGLRESLEKRQWPSGSSYPAFRPWCGIERQAARTRARPGAQPSATLFRAFGPSPLQGRRAAMQGRPAETRAIRRCRHTSTRSQDGKTGQCGPRTTLGARSLCLSRAIAQAVSGCLPTALQLLETRPVLATQAYTFKSSESRTRSGPETGPRLARQRALRARTRAGWPSPGVEHGGIAEGKRTP